MWRVLFVVVVVCAVCLFSVKAQTVNEADSSVIIKEKTIAVSLALENFRDISNEKILLELVDEQNKIRSQTAQSLNLKKGKNLYQFSLPLNDLPKTIDNDSLVWYRLRYLVGNSAGIVSISELLRDDFHLRVAASEVFRAGMNYRVRVRALQPYTKNPVGDVQIAATLQLELDTDALELQSAKIRYGRTRPVRKIHGERRFKQSI